MYLFGSKSFRVFPQFDSVAKNDWSILTSQDFYLDLSLNFDSVYSVG